MLKVLIEGNLMEEKVIYTNETPVLPEIVKYYKEHDYCEREIPLNADTANKIAEILWTQGINVKESD